MITLRQMMVQLLCLSSLWFGAVLGEQPAYQVSIYIRFHPRSPAIHLCNGAIIQSHLILTSGSCLYYQFVSGRKSLPIPPNMLRIVAGSGNDYNGNLLKMGVHSVQFAKDFNITTLEGDVALIRLERALPLAERSDMQWIILDDDEYKDHSCMASFNMRNGLDRTPDYTQISEVDIEPLHECLPSASSSARRRDICSQYILPEGFECDAYESFIPYNGDRGTGLVCNSRLVGVLSSILPLNTDVEFDCSEQTVNAMYTNVGPHLDWIYTHIADEELEDIMHVDYVASVPYHYETSSIIVQHTSTEAAPSSTKALHPDVDSGIAPSAPSTSNKSSASAYTRLHVFWFILVICILNLHKRLFNC